MADGSWRNWINPISLIAIGLVGCFGWLMILGDQGLLNWARLLHTKTALLETERTLAGKLEGLEQERERLHDPRALEPIIRKELGYVRSDELVFQFPEEKTPKPH